MQQSHSGSCIKTFEGLRLNFEGLRSFYYCNIQKYFACDILVFLFCDLVLFSVLLRQKVALSVVHFFSLA